MNVNNVRGQFSEDWIEKFTPFIERDSFDNIFNYLKQKSSSGRTIFPASKDLFKAFKITSLKDTRCIILGQDPYPQPGVADGLAFSCSNTMVCQPSLIEIHREIERTVYDGMNLTDNVYNPDLSYLANQGVLLLNSSLTTPSGKAGDPEHHSIWKPFMHYLFHEIIDKEERSIPIIAMGSVAQDLVSDLDWSNIVYTTKHPASATYNNGKWDCEDVFNKINSHLQYFNNNSINW